MMSYLSHILMDTLLVSTEIETQADNDTVSKCAADLQRAHHCQADSILRRLNSLRILLKDFVVREITYAALPSLDAIASVQRGSKND